jgi:AcrR family transcriptional regulator
MTRSSRPVTGMRQRKRQERHDALIDAATELFQTKGYEQTTMEEIAARADVSPPTLYRYFPRKTELLIAFFWKERERLAKALDDFQKKSAAMDAVESVAGLLYLNNSGVRSKAARKLWREAMAALLRAHDSADDEFRAVKRYFEKHIERMLQRLSRDSALSKDAPLPALVNVLYAVAAENYHRMLANEFSSADAEKAAMKEQVSAVLKGWLTKKGLP